VIRITLEDSRTAADAAAEVRAAFGRCDILVNSAGFTKPIPHKDLEALDDATFDAVLIANVRGPFAVIRAFAPLMGETGDAVIVNISSISAFTGSGSSIAYCAAKAALDTMSISLARALGPEIRVLCVSPAAVATDFVAGRDRGALEKLAANTPLKHVVEPEEVALAVMACVTHLPWSTGSRIVVDGGRHIV
jgi:3-oxoacyl-[acyl-carrier protein] reductase